MSNVSIEPVAWRVWIGDPDSLQYIYSEDGDGEPLYTATQLAAARQQGAEEQTDKTLEAVRVASERIAELEAELKIGRQNSFDGAVAAKRITEIEHHRNECERQLQASFDANVTLQDRIADLEKSNAQLLEALKQIEVTGPDDDEIVWINLHGHGTTGKAILRVGKQGLIAAQVARLFEEDRRAAIAEVNP